MSDNVINFMTNGGSQVFDKAGMLKFFISCTYVNKYSMETIISLKYVSDILRVRMNMDTAREKAIIVRIYSGNIYRFKQCDECLYYFDK